MTFILVTGSIMALSISLIYRLCRFFHIEMKCLSLVLCAVMAFVVNGVAIAMSPFLDRAHYLRLGLLVIVAAALVTFFNEKLLSREESAAKAADASPAGDSTQAAETPAVQDQPEPAESPAWKALPTETLPPEDQPIPPAAKSPQEIEAEHEAEAEAQARIRARQAEAEAKAAREAAEAEARKKALEQAAAAEKARKQAEHEAAAKEAARKKAAIEAAEKAAAEKTARAARYAGYIKTLESMDSLDSILDYAYENQSHEPEAAICAYQQAITRYPEDSYTPFLVIELGNLYKDQAAYHGAINTYIKALDMPIIAVNDAMKREFHKNLRYLGTVQDILSKHHALSTPFPEIPGEIMQEIETEFQRRSQQSS